MRGARAVPPHADTWIAVASEVTMHLSGSPPLEGAADRILDTLCKRLGWAAGAFWLRADGDDAIRCVGTAANDARAARFLEATCHVRFPREPVWVQDIAVDDSFRRRRDAARAGLSSAVAHPVMDGTQCVGVLELFRRDALPQPDEGVFELLTVVTGQLGHFVGRTRARRELERLTLEFETFAGTAAHDLSAPLHIMAGYVDLLTEHFAGRLDEDAQAYFAALLRNGERMRARIDGLSTFARVNHDVLATGAVDCRVVAEEVVDTLRAAIEQAGAVVTTGLLPIVEGDAAQLGQVIENLVSNALKFQDTGGPKIHVSAARTSGAWCITVADNGIGIEPADASRIFQPFVRAKTARRYEGSGIGLAICRRIVERHGGTIWVESTPGQGSTFRFTLPGAAPAA